MRSQRTARPAPSAPGAEPGAQAGSSTSTAQRGGPVVGRRGASTSSPLRAVARRRWSGRRRRRRRPGCRSPGPRRRPGRTTRCTTARRPAVAAAYHRASSACGDRRHEPHHVVDAELGRPARPAPRGARARCPDGPPTTGTTSREPQRRARARAARATARSSTSGALSGWIRPANSSTCGVRGQPERGGARRRVSRGRNTSRSTPGWTTSTRPGSASYRSISCLASMSVLAISMSAASTTCSSPMIRAGGLGGVAVGERVVLDLGHRVHRVHQRHAPAVAGQRADLAGEPVVGVHERRSGPSGWAASVRSTSRAKTHSWPGSSPLVSPSNGPAWMWRTVTPSPASTTGGSVARTVARVKMSTSMPRGGQPPGQLDDVDVHAAGVAGARLVQRRGVQADHRHPAYGVGLGELHDVTPSRRHDTGPDASNRTECAGDSRAAREPRRQRVARAGRRPACQEQDRAEPDHGDRRRRRCRQTIAVVGVADEAAKTTPPDQRRQGAGPRTRRSASRPLLTSIIADPEQGDGEERAARPRAGRRQARRRPSRK